MREDGLRIDRLLLTTNTTFIPTGFGPTESTRLANQTTLSTTITRTIVYTYDNLYRLTNANYSTGELFAYTYDPAGNRKTQTTLAGTNVYTYDGANRLTQVDGQSYSWDNNGNLLNDGVRSYVYDSANRLTSVTQGGTTTQFTYNGNGDRMAQIVGGVSTNYVLDPTGLAQVLMASIAGQSQYYLPGLAQYDTAWAYYLPDRLGSLRQLANNTGQVNLAQSYDPFGNVLQQTGSGQSIFGYTGEQIDPTGLVYLRARYYNPGTGRFLTADSIIPNPLNSMGWNRYAYGYNNPVKFVDPSGHQGEPWWEQVVRGIHGWVCSGWNSIDGCPGDVFLRALDLLPTNPAEDTLRTVQSTAGFDNSSLPNEPLITPNDLQHVQRFGNAFQAVEGGVASWNEFQHAAKGSFVGENANKANIGWQVYKQANQCDDVLVLGRQVDTDAWYGEEGHQILRIPPEDWAIPVNDSWVQGGIDRGATFRVVSPIEDSLWDEFNNRPTILARELEQLRQAGYNLSDNGEYMLPPLH